VLSLGVFVNLTQTDGVVLQSILSKVFWLALAGLAFGALLFALPYILPNRRVGHVDLVSADVNPDLSNYSTSARDDGSISQARVTPMHDVLIRTRYPQKYFVLHPFPPQFFGPHPFPVIDFTFRNSGNAGIQSIITFRLIKREFQIRNGIDVAAWNIPIERQPRCRVNPRMQYNMGWGAARNSQSGTLLVTK
jgi:hypothetical protein